jgi:hypothetical protein
MTHNIIETENYLLLVSDEINFAHLPLNNSPVLEGVPLLPPLEDEAESLSLKSVNKRGYTTDDYQDGFEDGYNKAKEKYKYTEEDLRKAMAMYKGEFTKGIVYTQEQIIKSLQQPKMPVGFECDMIRGLPIHNSNDVNVKTFIPFNPNTKINPQGQSVLVGKYIY